MTAIEERPTTRRILEDDLDKELEAFIISEDKSQNNNSNQYLHSSDNKIATADKNGIKDMDKDLNDLLEGIEKGQLEMNTVEKEQQDPLSTEVKTEDSAGRTDKAEDDMDVFVLPEDEIAKPPHPASDGDVSSDNDEDHDYKLTEDQKRASLELEQLLAETEYFPDEEPPEYDVKDRIKQLNAELANEPMPDEREHKVMFKENPVDMVVPPAEWEEPAKEDNTDSSTMKSPTDSDKTEESVKFSDDSSQKDRKHKVLIERDGKFELVSADDIRARDLGMLSLSDSNVEEHQPNISHQHDSLRTDGPDKESSVIVSAKPQPPSGPRPSSGIVSSHRNVRPVTQRPHSATVVEHGSALRNFTYVSPYALSPQEKQQLQECVKRRENREKNLKTKKKEEDNLKQRENEEAFEAWLKRKHYTSNQIKFTASQERKSLDGNKTNYFKEWLQVKKEQNKREKLLKQREEEERRCGLPIRSQKECEKAFREWLRRKNYEAWRRRGLERQRFGRLSSARRTYKSLTPLQLANFYRLSGYHSY